MGLRFRQSFQLFPGVRLNLGKTGVSASFGIPGATLNVGPKGMKSTFGIPGTGISYTHHHTNNAPQFTEIGAPPSNNEFYPEPQPHLPLYYQPQMMQMRQINSASVEELTSESLVELRDMIAEARNQRGEIQTDLKEAQQLHANQTEELKRKQKSLFRFFYKRRMAELEENIPVAAAEIDRLTEWLDCTHIAMQFETSLAAKQAYGALVRAFEKLRNCTVIWDVTSDRFGNRVIERSYASRSITRTAVKLDYATTDLIQFDGKALRFENANGEAILIYPGVIIMPRADGAFALIDMREVRLEFSGLQFVEDETVPADSEIVGYTWAKVNKDGSPDRRFRDNYQIPLCVYGRMIYTSEGGIQEEYQFSNPATSDEFGHAFVAYQSALSAS